MAERSETIRETDRQARAMARDLLDTARIAALGVIHPETGAPHVSRIAVGPGPEGAILTLISALSLHTRALRTDPRGSILIGRGDAATGRGDPLNRPRMTLSVRAHFIDRDTANHAALREVWTTRHPGSELYVDFADFSFVSLEILAIALTAGFAKAYELSPDDLTLG